jgi:Holliday junction DNA helicase RuvA
MIGCLIGEVFALEAPTVLLNVNGVGYEIDTPLSTFCQLQKGQKVTLWTHLVVREDAQQLYGFSDAQEKIIFRTLLKVNGVGPKMALGILSTLSVDMLIHTVEHGDVKTLVKVPGVGTKTAERLMIEAIAVRAAQDTINGALTEEAIQYRYIEMMRQLSTSPNAKVIVVDSKQSLMLDGSK